MIRVEGIRKVFNKNRRSENEVLKGVSFTLPNKGLISIFGKSGSGKTTLLNIIGGLDKQTSGKIYIDDVDTKGKVDKIRNAKIGFIFQNYYLENGYTIEEIMQNAMIIAGFKDKKEIKRRTLEVLKLVKMDRYKNKTADSLSGGQKQRVAIARALIKGSDIILADEPTGNLDSENTYMIMDILKEISKTQLVVLVTHEVNLISKYADSYIKLIDGELRDDLALDNEIEVEVKKQNIYVDETNKRTLMLDDTTLDVYGTNLSKGDIEIFSDEGSVYIRPGKNVKVIDENSEKKIIFKGDERVSETLDEVPSYTKSNSKRNGKLFNFRNVWKSRHFKDEEKSYSAGNIFKQLFLIVIALLTVFTSVTVFENISRKVENKVIDESSVYLDMGSYPEIRNLKEELYDEIDFFELDYADGEFAFVNQNNISAIKAKYAPKSLKLKEEDNNLELIFGSMPKDQEILISTKLEENLKKELRYEEFQNHEVITSLIFNHQYSISGIIEDEAPLIYFNRVDYVNFLNIYSDIKFQDSTNLFFDEEMMNKELNQTINSFKAKIDIYQGSTLTLKDNEAMVEINRSSTYLMMNDSKDADYKIDKANRVLLESPEYINIFNSHPMFVKEFKLNRLEMKGDIIIYVNENTMNNIFSYISPNLDQLNKDGNYFFEIKTSSEEQLNKLNERLHYRGCQSVDINTLYENRNNEYLNSDLRTYLIISLVFVLLLIIYYFIEKSSSIKNAKEYGIFRAIGINKSNLLYKETILALKNSLITYILASLVFISLCSVRYYMMNVSLSLFIPISLIMIIILSLLMILISLIPYSFVLTKTPSEIISRYDI